MAMPEQFSLRWNDFYSNLAQSFQTFLAGKDLVDVTLAVEGQYVHAHKLILSVCSPYFKELFKMNPCEHPIVFLKDVTYHELHQLIQFMYRGEVHVRQQELSGFLHTAEMLQVKGLTSSRDRSESPPPVLEEPPVESKMQIQQPIELSNDSQPEWIEDAAVEPPVELPPVIKEETARSPLKRLLKVTPNKNSYMKKKHRAANENAAMPEKVEYSAGAGGYDDEPLIDFDNDLQMIHHHSVLVLPKSPKEPAAWLSKTGGVKCPSCHRIFANRYNLKVHIRDKHDTREGTLQCEICNKRMRNPSCLRVHMYHHRKQAAYMAQMNAPSEFGRLMQGIVGVKHEWRNDGQAATPEHMDNDKIQNIVGVKHEWRNDGQAATPEDMDNDKAQGATGVKTEGQAAAAGIKENDVGEAASPQQAAGESAAPAHV